MTTSKKRKQQWLESFRARDGQLFSDDSLRRVAAQQADPFSFSQLAYWLGLEVWTREEGVLVLAGVEPGTVREEEVAPFMAGAGWINAMPFAQNIAFFQLPDPPDLTLEDCKGDEDSFEAYLEGQEDRRATLKRHQKLYESLMHKLDHSPSALGPETGHAAWRPVSFLAWARSIDFEPEWLAWAKKKGVLPLSVEPMAAPFFDADSTDYPELLHIAVRAWEEARKGTEGTPKQRVLDYLATSYPHLLQGSRDAIAQVVNWQRTGGRPPKRDEKGG